MRVLAIDTALEACSAAVLDTERGGILASESLAMARGHAEALMPLVGRVMQQSTLKFLELDRIAVTVGPGSFTGLRVGVAAARGIAVAAGKPAVGLTTLAAYAAPYIAADDVTPLLAAIDARNEQVYMQLFGPGGRTIIHPKQMTPVRAAYAVPEAEAAYYRKVVTEFEVKERQGIAAITIDGKLVDYAMFQRAKRVLDLANLDQINGEFHGL